MTLPPICPLVDFGTVACDAYGVSGEELCGKPKPTDIIMARKLFIVLARTIRADPNEPNAAPFTFEVIAERLSQNASTASVAFAVAHGWLAGPQRDAQTVRFRYEVAHAYMVLATWGYGAPVRPESWRLPTLKDERPTPFPGIMAAPFAMAGVTTTLAST